MLKIVLDTNCLISSLSSYSTYFPIWSGLQDGKFMIFVSNSILDEYQEIIEEKTNAYVAQNVIRTLLESPYVKYHEPSYHFGLITQDPDDNKFVDCAIVSNADFIVTEDKHFNVLKEITFPKVSILGIDDFLHTLEGDPLPS